MIEAVKVRLWEFVHTLDGKLDGDQNWSLWYPCSKYPQTLKTF